VCGRHGQCDQIVFSVPTNGQFASGVEQGISHRTDMGVDSPEVAQDVEMQRGGLDGLGSAFAQAVASSLKFLSMCSRLMEKEMTSIARRRVYRRYCPSATLDRPRLWSLIIIAAITLRSITSTRSPMRSVSCAASANVREGVSSALSPERYDRRALWAR
jgi:hypothetical protein